MSISYKKMMGSIKKAVQEVDPTAQVILFGSRARRTAHKESDWDVLILVDKSSAVTSHDENLFRDKLYDVALETRQLISTFAYSLKDWHGKMSATSLYQNVMKEGIIL